MPSSLDLRARLGSLLRTDSLSRLDAVPSASSAGASAVSNSLSGLGGARDSGTTARPNVYRQYLAEDELVALLRGSVYRRIIWLYPHYATQRGWKLTDDTKEAAPLEAAFRRFRVAHLFRQADAWGRALGEARLWLVTDDPAPLSEPLDLGRVRRLHNLVVLDRREFSPCEYETDPRQPGFGEPRSYWIHPSRGGATHREPVHHTRLLRFYGDDLPPSEEGLNWGADAVGQVLWDALRNMAQTSAAGARAAQELSLAVFQIADVPGKDAGDERGKFQERLALMNLMKSMSNAVYLGIADKFSRVPISPSGFKDLSEDARLQLGLLTGLPMTLLFGEAPAGFNTDGDSWWKNWGNNVHAWQESRYRDPLEVVTQILYITEMGAIPDVWRLDFNPLGQLSQKELAEIRKLHTEADSTAIKDGVLSPVRIRRSRYGEDGWSLDIQPPTPEEQELEAAKDKKAAETPAPPAVVPGPAGLPALGGEKERADAATPALPPIPLVLLAPLPPSATALYEAMAGTVRTILPGLEAPAHAPHLTVLHFGAVSVPRLRNIDAAVRQVLEGQGPITLQYGQVSWFSPTPEGKTPVVIEYRRHALSDLNARLLRACAVDVSSEQHARYRPHLTLGYLPRLPTDAEMVALEALVVSGRWEVGQVELHSGAEVIGPPFRLGV